MDAMSERPTIAARFSPEQKDELEAMCENAGIAPGTLTKKLLLSALDYYKEHGDIPLPPVIVRAKEALILEEMRGDYNKGKPDSVAKIVSPSEKSGRQAS